MESAVAVVLKQWPSLAAVILIAGAFWVIFKQFLDENSRVLKSYAQLITQHKEDSDRYRTIVRSLLDENEKIRKSYDEIKVNLSNVLFENQALRRTVDRVEEMVRAVGGDFRVVSTEISRARQDIKAVSDQVNSIARIGPQPDDSSW